MKIRKKRYYIADKGQTLVEYALILTLSVMVIFLTVQKFQAKDGVLKSFYKKSVDTRVGTIQGLGP